MMLQSLKLWFYVHFTSSVQVALINNDTKHVIVCYLLETKYLLKYFQIYRQEYLISLKTYFIYFE